MEILELPSLEKSTINKEVKAGVASCCAPKIEQTVCYTPGTSPEENSVPCCAQPEDGSACCNKLS